MQLFNLAHLTADRDGAAVAYQEFLRVPALSIGLYNLPAGEIDPQRPHGEDEVYYVAGGRGRITVGAEDRAVGPGTIVYVPAGVEHRFHSIAEDLSVLVFFAPAEYTAAAAPPPMAPGEGEGARQEP